MSDAKSCAVLFGGTGFVGVFFAEHLLKEGVVDKVYLVDRERIRDKQSLFRRRLFSSLSSVEEIVADVRSEITWSPQESVRLSANFAAVHREPGHEDYEYYETNLLGAENVCAWAVKNNCSDVIFTSSISPYGPSEQVRDEKSIPVPTTAYGGSKLVAEKIHQNWLAESPGTRNLVIVRPGVVFGPGEGGNVSRLIRAVLGRYFFYMGNRATRKAGIYVKELCRAMLWVLEAQKKQGRNLSLFNMSMNPGPSIQEYALAVCSVAGVNRFIPAVPYWSLLVAANVIDFFAKPLGVSHPFSPVRIRKLVRSNNIRPGFLIDNGYSYQYSLESSFSDWKESCPEEWQC